MPRYTHPDTGHTIETSIAREGVQLKAGGYREVPVTKFDPSEHSVGEVQAHLADADPDERARVLAAEEDGKARKTLLQAPEADGSNGEPEGDGGGDIVVSPPA